ERAARVAEGLFEADFFSGWGIRTLSRRERRFNPASYHNGSVWPHDNALIALGLAHYGHCSEALALTTALFDAAAHMHLRRLPELFCGFERRPGKAPILYPVACAPQAWAAVAPFALIGSKWKDVDRRVKRTVQVVRLDTGKRRVRIHCIETDVLSWAKPERFGKSGGYTPL